MLVNIFYIELSQLLTSTTGVSGHQRYPEHRVSWPAHGVAKLLELAMAEKRDQFAPAVTPVIVQASFGFSRPEALVYA